ncbi:conserved protein of unknown function [Micropruina glycogenica]|jgi:uncharacterized protein DUF4307|uniref:DUF4307 domain-containing protein n=1 Tax=Micropruina glycogenica TaxID=75385 RepID=A0A2N9JNC3_9ACTN|nr:conserved protein of unknown function [Micropruina glycogenica]
MAAASTGRTGQNDRVTITEADRERVRRRYPKQRFSPAVLAVLGLVVLALVAYVVWVATSRANPQVSGRIDTFAVVSDNEMTATLTVDRPDPSVAAKCFVIVQAVTYDRVGELWVQVPPGTERLTTVPVSVRTFKRGTAITVESCGPAT